MPTIPSIHTWSDGDIVYAADLNGNCSTIRTYTNTYCAFLDGNQTFSGTNTFSAAVTTSAGITVNTTGITIAPQTAITFSHASARIIPGATGLYLRDTANAADNVAITDAGAVTVRAGLTIGGALTGVTGLTIAGALAGVTTLAASGTVTLTGQTVTHSHATGKHLIGATSWALKDSGDSVNIISATGTGASTSVFLASGSGGGMTVRGPSANAIIGFSGEAINLASSAGNITLGGGVGIATTAAVNIPSMPTMAGIPTGAGGLVHGSFVLDTTNHRLYCLSAGGVWKYAALT